MDLDDPQRFDFDGREQFSLIVARKRGDLVVFLHRDGKPIASLKRSKALRLRRVVQDYAFNKPRRDLKDETEKIIRRIDDIVAFEPGITLKKVAQKLWPKEPYSKVRFRLMRAIRKSGTVLHKPFRRRLRDRNTVLYPGL